MQLRIFTEPQQGASHDQLLAVARATEANGFDAFFRSDHLMRMGEGTKESRSCALRRSCGNSSHGAREGLGQVPT
jgi:alkanesulfonate monooxygenase SsuD/methylene tetrahydromethanopterin reductase-like flavin-dependent oxidoreductase (luciferase family)